MGSISNLAVIISGHTKPLEDAMKNQKPEWSDEQIAKKVGVVRTSLYRYEKFMAARATLKEGRKAFKEWQQT